MWTFLRRRTLTQWIVVAMFVGVALGVFFPAFARSLLPISTAFIRIIKSIIVPLIFGTLVVGIAGHGDDMKRVGRLALKSIVYFEIVTTLAVTVGQPGGLRNLHNLAMVVLTLYIALVVFGLVVLYPVARLARVPLGAFLAAVKEPALIAFSTASSEAALPKAMERMEAIGVPRRIVAFVMPTGYSFNLDGSTLYLSVASIFVAQAGGVALTLGQQLLMMLTLMLTSKGVAGVPRAALVILMGTVASFHLPGEMAVALLGVDVLMDMARTTVNLIGNCLATVVMAPWEHEYDESKAQAVNAIAG